MQLTAWQMLILIACLAAGTQLTRWLPFLLFPENRTPPRAVIYLGKVLPGAMMGLLVVYCLRNVNLMAGNHGLPEGIALGVLVLVHGWKRNVLVSIAGATVVYMLLVQVIFA